MTHRHTAVFGRYPAGTDPRVALREMFAVFMEADAELAAGELPDEVDDLRLGQAIDVDSD